MLKRSAEIFVQAENPSIEVQKDIAYFYQVMSEYGHIMGDLDYDKEFGGAYWSSISVDSPELVRQGALAILIAQVSDFVDGSGDSITAKLECYSRALDLVYPQTSEEDQLIEVARLAVEVVRTQEPDKTAEFEATLPWVYDFCVRRYFSERSK